MRDYVFSYISYDICKTAALYVLPRVLILLFYFSYFYELLRCWRKRMVQVSLFELRLIDLSTSDKGDANEVTQIASFHLLSKKISFKSALGFASLQNLKAINSKNSKRNLFVKTCSVFLDEACFSFTLMVFAKVFLPHLPAVTPCFFIAPRN